MKITWDTSTYSIPERDKPDFPIVNRILSGGSYARNMRTGALYNPAKYRYRQYDFTFTGITPTTVDVFTALFKLKDEFNITDDLFGDVDVIPVMGSLTVAYLTLNTCNLSFSVEGKEAI